MNAVIEMIDRCRSCIEKQLKETPPDQHHLVLGEFEVETRAIKLLIDEKTQTSRAHMGMTEGEFNDIRKRRQLTDQSCTLWLDEFYADNIRARSIIETGDSLIQRSLSPASGASAATTPTPSTMSSSSSSSQSGSGKSMIHPKSGDGVNWSLNQQRNSASLMGSTSSTASKTRFVELRQLEPFAYLLLRTDDRACDFKINVKRERRLDLSRRPPAVAPVLSSRRKRTWSIPTSDPLFRLDLSEVDLKRNIPGVNEAKSKSIRTYEGEHEVTNFDQVLKMSGAAFFIRLCRVLAETYPLPSSVAKRWMYVYMDHRVIDDVLQARKSLSSVHSDSWKTAGKTESSSSSTNAVQPGNEVLKKPSLAVATSTEQGMQIPIHLVSTTRSAFFFQPSLLSFADSM
jgi:hypothetical protein